MKTAPDAAHAAGVSYRQLDYWSRIGFIVPITEANGHGSRRGYDDVDVRRLMIAKRLLDHGFTLDRVRTALNFSRETLSVMPVDDAYLMIIDPHDGVRTVALVTRAQLCDALVTTLHGRNDPVTVINVAVKKETS